MGSSGWALTQCDGCPYRKRRQGHRQAEEGCRHEEKTAVHRPWREASEHTNPAGTLTLGFQIPELIIKKFECIYYIMNNKDISETTGFCGLSHPVCGTFLWNPGGTDTTVVLDRSLERYWGMCVCVCACVCRKREKGEGEMRASS